MKTKFSVLFVVGCLICNMTMGQLQFSSSFDEFENFDYNIKQIDEFMLRFNLKELLVQPDQRSTWRNDNRVLLFDKSYYLQNETYLNSFIEEIDAQQVTLQFYDSTWFAIAECDVMFKGKKDKILLTLRTEQVKDDLYKWSIVDAFGVILDLNPKTQSDKLKILPSDNEVNFISLQSITTTNAPNITRYSKNGYSVDRLSVFNGLVYNKLLEIKTVSSLTYCFTQVKGYRFYVKKFVREEKNAGWLIYKVEKENNDKQPQIKNEQNNVSQIVVNLYKSLSDYSKSPANITLARNIKNMFISEQSKLYVFGAKHIYNDIDEFIMNHQSSYPYLSITEYLHSIENHSKQGLILQYHIQDITISSIKDGSMIATYRVKIHGNKEQNYEYDAKIILQDGKIKYIMPLSEEPKDIIDKNILSLAPLSLYFSPKGGENTVTISSDTAWEISMNTLSWGHLIKKGKNLTIRVNENTSTKERTDYFKIKSAGKEQRIEIRQGGSEIKSFAKIYDCYIEHNLSRSMWNGYMWENTNYLCIHSHVVVQGQKGNKIKVCAFFYRSDGTKVNAVHPDFKTRDGQATVQWQDNCSFDNTEWKDVQLNIPYYALPKGNLVAKIQIQDLEGRLLSESQEKSFVVH